MKVVDRPFKRSSDTELQSLVTRYERVLQAGISSHADIVALVAAEREIMYREAKQLRRTVHEERQARTVSNATNEGWLALGGVPARTPRESTSNPSVESLTQVQTDDQRIVVG